jgi:phage regulator Rha-like protein
LEIASPSRWHFRIADSEIARRTHSPAWKRDRWYSNLEFQTEPSMNKPQETQLVPIERVESLIHLARGEKVLLDADLATLYGVETRALNQAVRRNLSRFPADFMFQLTHEEAVSLLRPRSQSVIMKQRGKNIKYLPYAFTEQGVAMLSSVLRSERAVQVNVAIMRAFVSLRRMLATNAALARKMAELERHLEGHDQAIRSLFDAIRELMAPPAKPKREIGFHAVGKDTADGKQAISRRK